MSTEKRPRRTTGTIRRDADLIAAFGALALAVGVAQIADMPTWLRATVILPIVVAAPGYLVLQASLGLAAKPFRPLDVGVLSIGTGLAVIALTALLAALVPGAFLLHVIAGLVIVVSAALLAVAMVRRGADRRLAVAATS